MAGTRQSPDRRTGDRARAGDRRVLESTALRFAGRPGAPHGIVRHVGRESGERRDTPVLTGRVGDQFVLALRSGTDAEWYQNVRAADECVVVHDGRAYRAESPRLVDPAAVPEAFPAGVNRLLSRSGPRQYLRMDRGAEVPAEYREVTRRYPARPAVAGLAGAVLLAAVLWRAVNRRD
ncbi:nitroreductase family deazaflavin-dependent oxidoreductase [Halorussus aquaticus]|uniref:Nitroreductase family deazaflavin-dependent oxidoreductase n=1 Tax=Halorussus aquaticus TaxID=2953748 RepID=A0ABD5PWX3_9EURY|nr:nitroreductase family deazaflavin-dependent oxidoreductase [Halorussus aquaticus]